MDPGEREETEDADIAKLRSDLAPARRLGARFADAARASLRGASLFAWLFGVGSSLRTAELIGTSRDVIALSSCVVGVAVATFSGFDRSLASYGSLIRRFVAVTFLGGAAAGMLVMAALLASDGKIGGLAYLAFEGLALMVLMAYLRARRRPRTVGDQTAWDVRAYAADPIARLTTVAAIGLGITALAASSSVRCLAGGAEACRMRAEACREPGAAACKAAWAERGCNNGDARSCLEAGAAFTRGYGVAADPHAAERLLRRACTLQSSSCEEVDAIDAERGCAEHRAFACADLARRLDRRDPPRARRARESACLLGLDEACTPR